MNHCGIQRQQQNIYASEMKKMHVSSSDRRDPLICPKPRRVGLVNATMTDPMRPLRWHFSHQSDLCDSKAGADILDIVLSKGGGGEQSCTQIGSSPPFYSGSPPSRVSNPVIQDPRFGDQSPPPAFSAVSGQSSSPTPSSRKGGCVRANFGDKPAVRIEGFDCLDRDNRRNCSIPALA